VTQDSDRTRAGLLLGLAAYALWGVLPLYFKAMAQVRPTEIVAHRILWSLFSWARWRPPGGEMARHPRRRWRPARVALTLVRHRGR
jgi:EamA domain-containing membrane protein RarD